MLGKLALGALALALLAGCQPTGSAAQYEVATLVLPEGHPREGRNVFLEMGCSSCHRVAWEKELPEPVSATPAPTLNRILARRSAGSIATSIIVPSYHLSDEQRLMTDDGLSPMADFTEAMTVRELIDLVAYLRAQGADKVARTEYGIETPHPAL